MKQRVLPVLKRFFALLLCWFFTTNAPTAWAQTVANVPYRAYNIGTGSFESLTATSAEAVTASTTTMGTANTETWYVVNSNVTVSSRIEVLGTVNLILVDGKTLTAPKGIRVKSGVTLYIYGQNYGTGKVDAKGNNRGAGIGGNENESAGTIIIHGGTVKAEGDNQQSAAIGGGGNGNGGTVTIYGGNVEEKCPSSQGAGIGGGQRGKGGTVNIYGGNTTVTGGLGAAGIGGGWNGSGGTVNIFGGIVIANKGNQQVAGQPASQAIGRGEPFASNPGVGNVNIPSMKVFASSTASDPVASGNRESTCRSSYAKLVPCDPHTYENGHCKYCGVPITYTVHSHKCEGRKARV